MTIASKSFGIMQKFVKNFLAHLFQKTPPLLGSIPLPHACAYTRLIEREYFGMGVWSVWGEFIWQKCFGADTKQGIKIGIISLILGNLYLSIIYNSKWRTRWDSNPRKSCPFTRFPSVRLRPLGHVSAVLKVINIIKNFAAL